MGMFERAINYIRRLAQPPPEVHLSHGAVAEDIEPGSGRRRSRIRRAVGRAHRRVMTRLKQPPPHENKRP